MEIHYKCTMWCKIILDDKKISKEEVLQKLNEGQLPLEIGFDDDINSQWMIMDNTEEFMTPAENDGQSTIEFVEVEEDGYLQYIWDNSFEAELKRKKDAN